ncbi:YcbK family protein [Persicirhabdus sediminis]|uniref:DUF882 domain-containing protein n=1 Tax=Persicirhabdus sediminis TaxID=454144 RepID=A0A8J7SG88_9BACT|nr:D-Ala-D-Ala carboxypeptidase family metallohydrolase [Persicirhabdus sediminis]MBK1789960.1 DUF882 domain-containing protein [Persicirhabdus sediminis]
MKRITEILPEEDSLSALGRRKFLGLSGTAVAALMVSKLDSQAAYFGLLGKKPVDDIPHEWVQQRGADVLRYARHIEKLKLKNITPKMVIAPHFKVRGSIYNTLPPKSMWNNIGPTLKVIDEMVETMGAPVRQLTSIYRSPRYNRSCGGKSRSLHMQNMAIDVQFSGVSPSHVARTARTLRSRGLFRGGIGRYSSFVHVDTRGTNVSWG